MYESFYGLKAPPFSLLPDEALLYLSRRHRRAINLLEYGIMSQAGFVAITGDIGAGKTTIIKRFLKNADQQLTVGVLNNPSKNITDLLSWVAMTFDLTTVQNNEVKAYDDFVKFLISQYAINKRVVLVIDEAQNLSSEKLEELRMLSNINNGREQLLQIVLVGQPELLETLNRGDLVQLKQRISIHYFLGPLTPSETRAYIQHRLSAVGGEVDLISDEACAAVHYFTSGVPRLINLLCDQALVYGFSEEAPNIGVKLILEVAGDRNSTLLSSYTTMPDSWGEREFRNHIAHIRKQMETPTVDEL